MSSAPSASSSRVLHVVYAAHDVTAAAAASPAATATTAAAVESSSPALQSEGQGVNKPVVRKRAILDALQRAAASLSSSLSFHPVTAPTADLKQAELIHHPLLVQLFETGFQRWKALGAERDMYFSTAGRGSDDYSEFVASQMAPRAEGQQRPGSNVQAQLSYFVQDRMTPLTANTSNILRHDMAALLEAVKMLQTGISSSNSGSGSSSGSAQYVYAMLTQPGHHSSFSSFGGYCVCLRQLCEGM